MYEGFEKDVYTRVIHLYGKDMQLNQANEELAELIVAQNNILWFCEKYNFPHNTLLKDIDSVIPDTAYKQFWPEPSEQIKTFYLEWMDERADVEIVIEQMEQIFNDSKNFELLKEDTKKYKGASEPWWIFELPKLCASVLKAIAKVKRVEFYGGNHEEEITKLCVARVELYSHLQELYEIFEDKDLIQEIKKQKLQRLNSRMDQYEWNKLEKENESKN